MWIAPAVCVLLSHVASGSHCPDQGDSCRGVGEDDEAGLVQLRVRNLPSPAPPVPPSTLQSPAPDCSVLTEPADGPNRVVLGLRDAQACVSLIVGPVEPARQSMEALLKFYDNFYSFTYIAADPPAGRYTFPPEFADLGIYGGGHGGAPENFSRVNLSGEWQSIIDGLPAEGTAPAVQWTAPANDAFNNLRDCHPALWSNGNGGRQLPPVEVLSNTFDLLLWNWDSGSVVNLEVASAADNATIDGTVEPIIKDSDGNIVKSIDGQLPMQWLVNNVVLSPAIPGMCVKSLGGRVNQMFQILKLDQGFVYPLGGVGSLSRLNPDNLSVEFDGDGVPFSGTWSWAIALMPTLPFGCTDLACVVDAAPAAMNASGAYWEKVMAPTTAIDDNWQNTVVSLSSGPASYPGPVPLRQPPSLLKAAQTPGNSSLPDEVFAWLLDPSCTAGYFAFRKRPDGTEFGVFKFTTFGPDDCDTSTYGTEAFIETLVNTFNAFGAEAESRGVTRLLVDFAGNPGGVETYAWQFVQLMLPEVPYKHTCGSLSRPIPKAYDLWAQINLLPIEQFLGDAVGPGFRQDRADELEADPMLAQAVYDNSKIILEAITSFGLKNATDALQAIESGYTEKSAMYLLQSLTEMYMEGNCSNPFVGKAFVPPDPLDYPYNPQYETAYRHPEIEVRGGHLRNFTAQIYECAPHPRGNITNPFDDIIFVSDGTCGSSCYMAAGTSLAAARVFSNRSIRSATYGGIGGSLADARKTLSPTAFPGGNVNRDGDTYLDGVFSCLLVQIGLAGGIGNEQLLNSLANVWKELTSMVPRYAFNMPGFTQSQIFQDAFGPNAPPAEYVFTPTDLYMPAWFSGVSGTDAYEWDLPQLEAMHQLAAQGFK